MGSLVQSRPFCLSCSAVICQGERLEKLDHFFGSVASLMSNLLRRCVRASIMDLVHLVEEYWEGNAYDGCYNIMAGMAVANVQHLVHFFLVRGNRQIDTQNPSTHKRFMLELGLGESYLVNYFF